MGATMLGDADEEEFNLNCGNDKEYLGLCGIMALQDEISRGNTLRYLKSKLDSMSAGVRKRPIMVDGGSRKAKRKRKPSKKNSKCHNPSCTKQTPCEDHDICLIDNIFPKTHKGQKRGKPKTRRKIEKKCKEICPLGVLELSVPSKRLCMETWRQYSNVLPPCAITRLKEIVLDQKPLIEVSAAVECFNLHKKKCKKLALKRKRNKLRKMLLAKKKKRVPNRISQICARLAREMLNYLKTPKVIKLESEWAKLSQVIYTDMREMLKQMGARHLMNRHYLKDAAKKGAVWVGTILEQYEDMVLYDEIRDLEETEGPVLDIIDEILDAVWEYIDAANKLRNSESALNYFSGDISLAGEGGARKGSHATHTSKGSPWDDLKGGSDWDNRRGLEDAGGTHKLGIKLDKDYDLDSDVRRDIIETAGEVTRSITDMAEAAVTKSLEEMEEARRKQLEDDIIVLAKPRNAKSSESEVEADKDQDQTLNKDYEKDPDQRSASSQIAKVTDDINQEAEINKEEGIAGKENKENLENIDSNIPSQQEENIDNYIPSQEQENIDNNIPSQEQENIDNNIPSQEQENIDNNIPSQEQENIDNNIPSQEQENNLKPTSQSDKDGKPQTEQSGRRSSNVTFHKELKIGPINDDLLSFADETWPKDIPFPVVKPSVSITQSITTLGNITESEETVKDAAELTNQLSELLKTDVEDKPEKKAEESEPPHEIDQHEKPAEESQQPLDSDQVKELSTTDDLAKTKESKIPQEFITPYTSEQDLPSVSKTKESDDLTKTAELIDSTPKIEIEKPFKSKEIQQLIKDMDRDMKNVEDKRQKKPKPVPSKSPSKHTTKVLSPTRKDTKTIFDYKVRPETAPSWALKRVCSCRTTKKEYDRNLQTGILQREHMKNVFRESENLVKSLELWNRWIASTCEQIVTLKETSDAAKFVEGRGCATRCIIRQWRHLETNINQAAEQWKHCKITTHNKLRRSQKLLFSKY